MGTEIPPEEIGTCRKCGAEFRRTRFEDQDCCGNHKRDIDAHSEDCRRKGTPAFFKKPANRLYTLESSPSEILFYLQSIYGEHPNLINTGIAALSYKGAQLNYAAAEKVARYTKALAVLTAVLALVSFVNLFIALKPLLLPHYTAFLLTKPGALTGGKQGKNVEVKTLYDLPAFKNLSYALIPRVLGKLRVDRRVKNIRVP